jgi:hypothetical protein
LGSRKGRTAPYTGRETIRVGLEIKSFNQLEGQPGLKDKPGVTFTRVTELWIAVRVEDVRANSDSQR